jgi:hypothetical protein
MKFSRQCDRTGTKIEFELGDESTLDEVFEEFQNFLRACGYVIPYDEVITSAKMDG